MNRLADMCMVKDYILKVTYSSYIGWTVNIHKRGYSLPFVNVINQDKDIAFNDAYEEVKINEYADTQEN